MNLLTFLYILEQAIVEGVDPNRTPTVSELSCLDIKHTQSLLRGFKPLNNVFFNTSFSQSISHNVFLNIFLNVVLIYSYIHIQIIFSSFSRIFHNVFLTMSSSQRISHTVDLTNSSTQRSLHNARNLSVLQFV